jgi:hypothetical protein
MSKLGSSSHFFLIQIERDRFFIPGKFARVLREGASFEWLQSYKIPARITALEFITSLPKVFS